MAAVGGGRANGIQREEPTCIRKTLRRKAMTSFRDSQIKSAHLRETRATGNERLHSQGPRHSANPPGNRRPPTWPFGQLTIHSSEEFLSSSWESQGLKGQRATLTHKELLTPQNTCTGWSGRPLQDRDPDEVGAERERHNFLAAGSEVALRDGGDFMGQEGGEEEDSRRPRAGRGNQTSCL